MWSQGNKFRFGFIDPHIHTRIPEDLDRTDDFTIYNDWGDHSDVGIRLLSLRM